MITTVLALFVPFYLIYWLYDTAQGLKQKGHKMPSFALLVAPMVISLIGIVAVFSLVIGSAANGNQLSGGTVAAIGGIYLAIFLAGISSLVYYYQFSAALETYTHNQLSKIVLFLCFWFFNPIAVYLIQEKLSQPAHPGAQPPYPNV